jgi:GNAT superfamily N-acetyltransferase
MRTTSEGEMTSTSTAAAQLKIRSLADRDLSEADRVFRVAFGTFLGVPEPSGFGGDADYVRTRWLTDPSATVGAFDGERLIGSNFAENWGSFGFFGPLTVEPGYWDRGVAQQLLAPTMEIFHRWGNKHLGLFTFPHSPKHMFLYQKFGFWPRDLVALMGRELAGWKDETNADVARFSTVPPDERAKFLADCREVSDANFGGLDLSREIETVDRQKIGDTLLIWSGSRPAAFALCHAGAGSEAGSGVCYIKFAAVRPGPMAQENLAGLLKSCRDFALLHGAKKLTTGVNLARRETFRCLVSEGFRTSAQGVAMETGDSYAGYNRAGVYILDDWR